MATGTANYICHNMEKSTSKSFTSGLYPAKNQSDLPPMFLPTMQYHLPATFIPTVILENAQKAVMTVKCLLYMDSKNAVSGNNSSSLSLGW